MSGLVEGGIGHLVIGAGLAGKTLALAVDLQEGLRADIELDYDNGVPEGAAVKLMELFGSEEIIIQKRTKRKELADVDIAPMIHSAELTEGEGMVRGTVVVQAQNPGLNPQLLERAIANYLPELVPDFVRVRRRELLDAEGKIFR